MGLGMRVAAEERTLVASNILFGLFHIPSNWYPIPFPSLVLFVHPHTFRSSFNKENRSLHPSFEGRGNVVVSARYVLASLSR